MAAAKSSGGDLAVNRKARFQYHLLERFECGMELLGTEVKSIREGGASFADAYVHVARGEAWMDGFHIRVYAHASPAMNHSPVRPRRLLLKRNELAKIEAATQQAGMTVVPVRLYPKGRWLKLEVALARGKQLHDKRETVKARIADREMSRAMKGRR